MVLNKIGEHNFDDYVSMDLRYSLNVNATGKRLYFLNCKSRGL